jgi:prephenate dehydrogenase
MKVAVLGAAGEMGKWLVQYLVEGGHTVTVFDIRQEELRALSKNYNVKLARDNFDAVKDAELTVVSVPINKTVEVLREIFPKLKKGSAVSEIASLKTGIIDVLKESSKFNVQPLSLHPLFGPLWMGKKRFALIPVLNVREELATAKKFFPDAQIIVVDVEKHDRVMAVTLSLTYFVNTAFALTIRNEDFKALENLRGTTFTLQQILMGAVMIQDSELHASLHFANKHAPEYIKKFVLNAEKLRKLIDRGDAEVFMSTCDELSRDLSKSLDLVEMYEKMYAILKALEISKK